MSAHPSPRDVLTLGVARPRLRHVVEELRELLHALRERDALGALAEWEDVHMICIIWVQARVDQPLDWTRAARRAVSRNIARMAEWERLFASHNLPFHPRHLVAGLNHEDPRKVAAALAHARAHAREKKKCRQS